jgi:hypothetical protein
MPARPAGTWRTRAACRRVVRSPHLRPPDEGSNSTDEGGNQPDEGGNPRAIRWTISGPSVAHQWTIRWTISGQSVDHQWTISGPSVDHQWTISGPSVDHQWTISGPSVDHQWTISGPSVDHQWTISGPSVDHQWTISGRHQRAIHNNQEQSPTSRVPLRFSMPIAWAAIKSNQEQSRAITPPRESPCGSQSP